MAAGNPFLAGGSLGRAALSSAALAAGADEGAEEPVGAEELVDAELGRKGIMGADRDGTTGRKADASRRPAAADSRLTLTG